MQFFRDWYPVMVLPLLYKEVEVFATAFGNDRRLGYFLAPIVAGIYVATVYGRFHYALDVFPASPSRLRLPAMTASVRRCRLSKVSLPS